MFKEFYTHRTNKKILLLINKKWQELNISWTDAWHRVVFSNEKKFNLDGPIGFCHYYYDLRKASQSLFQKANRWGLRYGMGCK